MTLATHPFAWTSIDTLIGDGGAADLLRGNAGDDVIIGGQGADRITGGTGDDDLIGGHNVAGGSDTGDFIDGGDQNDVIAGDNADLLPHRRRLEPPLPGAHGRRDLPDRHRLREHRRGRPVRSEPDELLRRPARRQGAQRHAVRPHGDDSANTPAVTFGDDVIAGGAEDDVIFGQLGDDWLQGDGSAIDDSGAITIDVRTHPPVGRGPRRLRPRRRRLDRRQRRQRRHLRRPRAGTTSSAAAPTSTASRLPTAARTEPTRSSAAPASASVRNNERRSRRRPATPATAT